MPEQNWNERIEEKLDKIIELLELRNSIEKARVEMKDRLKFSSLLSRFERAIRSRNEYECDNIREEVKEFTNEYFPIPTESPQEKGMNYLKHLKENWKVGIKLAVLSFFHFLHGIIRTEKTSHKYWGIE